MDIVNKTCCLFVEVTLRIRINRLNVKFQVRILQLSAFVASDSSGLSLTLCVLQIYLLTYLLTYIIVMKINEFQFYREIHQADLFHRLVLHQPANKQYEPSRLNAGE